MEKQVENKIENKSKKAKKVKLKKEVKGVLIFAAVITLLLTLYIIVHQLTKFDYVKNQESIILTINDTNINLKEISYYIIQIERTGNEYAKQYNSENLADYWGLYMNQGNETGYVTDLGKAAVMNFCIRDNIYAMEADKEGMELTSEELEEIRLDAESTYQKLSARELEMSGLSEQDLILIMTKEQLAHKYMIQKAVAYEEGALEAITLIYDVGGTYYESLKNSYVIVINEKLWKHIKIGHVTIN